MDEKTRLVLEVMQLAYLVQRYTEYCIFIRYSGHIDSLEIDIRKSRKEWDKEILKTEISKTYQEYYEKRDLLRELKTKRDVLAKIINEQRIPYEDVNVEQYLVEEYTF